MKIKHRNSKHNKNKTKVKHQHRKIKPHFVWVLVTEHVYTRAVSGGFTDGNLVGSGTDHSTSTVNTTLYKVNAATLDLGIASTYHSGTSTGTSDTSWNDYMCYDQAVGHNQNSTSTYSGTAVIDFVPFSDKAVLLSRDNGETLSILGPAPSDNTYVGTRVDSSTIDSVLTFGGQSLRNSKASHLSVTGNGQTINITNESASYGTYVSQLTQTGHTYFGAATEGVNHRVAFDDLSLDIPWDTARDTIMGFNPAHPSGLQVYIPLSDTSYIYRQAGLTNIYQLSVSKGGTVSQLDLRNLPGVADLTLIHPGSVSYAGSISMSGFKIEGNESAGNYTKRTVSIKIKADTYSPAHQENPATTPPRKLKSATVTHYDPNGDPVARTFVDEESTTPMTLGVHQSKLTPHSNATFRANVIAAADAMRTTGMTKAASWNGETGLVPLYSGATWSTAGYILLDVAANSTRVSPPAAPSYPSQVVDPHIDSVISHLQSDGTYGASAIKDISKYAHPLKVRGNIRQSSKQPLLTRSSFYFDGKGSSIEVAIPRDLGLGASDYTIDMWVRPTGQNASLLVPSSTTPGIMSSSESHGSLSYTTVDLTGTQLYPPISDTFLDASCVLAATCDDGSNAHWDAVRQVAWCPISTRI